MNDNKTNRYHRGKIYAIRSHQTPDIYIGSSIQPLYKRLSKHKCDYKVWKNGKKHYISSFEILKYPDCYIELIEEYKCNNKMELERREGQIIRDTENCVNKNIVGRTNREYYEDNKEKVINKVKEYYKVNKEKILEYKKVYRENTKEYRRKRDREYYHNNREIIKEKRKVKIICECGSSMLISNRSAHLKTKKHKDYLTALDTNRDSSPTTPTADN